MIWNVIGISCNIITIVLIVATSNLYRKTQKLQNERIAALENSKRTDVDSIDNMRRDVERLSTLYKQSQEDYDRVFKVARAINSKLFDHLTDYSDLKVRHCNLLSMLQGKVIEILANGQNHETPQLDK